MNKEIEKILKEELRFENQYYSSFKTFKDNVISIYEKLKGKFGDKTEFTLKEKIKIKEDIKKFLEIAYQELTTESEKEIAEQFNILEEREGVSPIVVFAVLFQGLNLSDLMLKQYNYHLNKLYLMVNNSNITREVFFNKAVLEQINTVVGTIAKQGREDIRNKKIDKDIIGWRSIAVLDGKTSSICLSKHNKFYSKEDYKKREDIPDLPPRHYNCRSIIINVYDKNIDTGDDLNTFFKENEEEALDILGKGRYELFKSGKIDFKSFLDVRREKLYTIKEIKERLK